MVLSGLPGETSDANDGNGVYCPDEIRHDQGSIATMHARRVVSYKHQVRNTDLLLWSAVDLILPSPLPCYGPLTVTVSHKTREGWILRKGKDLSVVSVKMMQNVYRALETEWKAELIAMNGEPYKQALHKRPLDQAHELLVSILDQMLGQIRRDADATMGLKPEKLDALEKAEGIDRSVDRSERWFVINTLKDGSTKVRLVLVLVLWCCWRCW